MNSRLIKLFLAVLVLLSILFSMVPRILAATYSNISSNRKVLNFNTNWKYNSFDVAGGQAVDLNESNFVDVSVPHSNKVLNKHKFLDLHEYQFVSWYRRHFAVPSTYSGRRIAVEFQAVGNVADVWVNGTYVGQHKGAYTPFTFDITNLVNVGTTDNIIAVRVDSTVRGDVPPEGANMDYVLFGGIARDVNMIITDPLHVDWTFITTPTVNQSSVVVNARTNVVNQSSTSKSATVTTVVVDANNNVMTSVSSTQTVGANGAVEFNQNTPSISSPHLWHPDDPYLYKVYTQVQTGGVFVDEYVTRVGFRSILFNGSGFFINGQSFKLRGLDRHEMFPFIGRSAPNRLQVKDAEILKNDLGVNMFRTSHYPQDPEFLNRADELGLLMIEEIPGWQHIGDQAWKNVAIKNVEEMIMRDRNHPSIITWGVRINESGDDHDFYTATNAKAHSLDSTRPTSGVRNFPNSEFLEDLFTYNDFSNPPGTLINPTRLPWLVTEYLGHQFPTKSYDSEDRLVQHMKLHASVQNSSMMQPSISGAIGWAAFDYNTNPGFCENNVCYHGVMDIWRVAKHAAYVYKSQVDRVKYGPVIYIANYWTSTSSTTVDVASNCEEVELFVNNVSRGRKTPNLYTRLPHPLIEFTGITFQAGDLRADCRVGGSVVTSTTRKTPGAVTRLVLTADSTSLVADGSDMTRVIITAVDSNNQMVPYAANTVSISVTGVGTFLGESPIALEGGRAGFFVRSVLNQTGSINVQATASGVTGSTITMSVAPMTAEIVPLPSSIQPTTTAPLTVSIDDSIMGSDINKFNYAGATWNHGACTASPACYNNTNSWDNVTNESVTLRFSGTQIRFYGVKDPTHGIGAVSLDGGAETNIDFYAATRAGNQLLWTSPVLSSGIHTFRLRVTGTRNGSSSNTWIVPDRADVISGTAVVPTNTPTPSNGTTTVDDRITGTGQNQFNYVGAWQSCAGCGADLYAGTNSWDNTANDSVTVVFVGTQIRLYGVKDPTHGIGAVSIDGGAEVNIDFYATARAGNTLLWTSPVLSTGTHTFKLRVTGTKTASATNTWIVPDRVDIIAGGSVPTATNTPVSVPTNTAAPTNTASPTATSTGSISPTAWYNVINQNSNKCVDASNNGTTNGTIVLQWSCGTGANQQWQFTPTDSGYYKVVPRHATGLAWDVSGAGTGDNAQVLLWSFGGGTNQQWQPVALGGGYYRFAARHSGKCLAVPNSSTTDGTQLVQFTCNGGTNQAFRLVQQP